MKAIIIEDEIPAADRLKKLISNIGMNIEVIAVLDSIKSGIEWFRNNEHPNLVFLDIQLADGQSFEIFKTIKINSPIIFTTAYDEHALKAFEQNCIDYLLKPIDEAKLKRSLDKMSNWMTMGNERLPEILENVFAQRLTVKKYKERFLVKGKDKLISIDIRQVAYFHSINRIVLLVTHENRSFPVDQTLEELEGLLDPQLFFRLNRAVTSSHEAIQSVEPYFNGKLLIDLLPGIREQIFVSREKAKTFKLWMGE